MRSTVALSAALSAVFVPVPAAAEGAPRVDQICAAARRRADASPEKARLFAAILTSRSAGDRSLHGEWQAYAGRRELDALFAGTANTEDRWVYDEALVWDLPGNALIVAAFTTSFSGDWVHQVDYCFRADGTLAFTESTLSTFNALDVGVRRFRERRFDRKGELLWVTSRVVDLETGDVRKNPEFMDQDEPIFKNRARLPFAHLL